MWRRVSGCVWAVCVGSLSEKSEGDRVSGDTSPQQRGRSSIILPLCTLNLNAEDEIETQEEIISTRRCGWGGWFNGWKTVGKRLFRKKWAGHTSNQNHPQRTQSEVCVVHCCVHVLFIVIVSACGPMQVLRRQKKMQPDSVLAIIL